MLTKVQYDMLADDAKAQITAASPFVFDQTIENGATKETLSKYKVTENNVTHEETVRKAELVDNKFVLTLATFTPALSVDGVVDNTLNWDVPATGFKVNVNNPSDYTSKYIDAVRDISPANPAVGSVSTTLADFVAGDKLDAGGNTITPVGGADWVQTFDTVAKSGSSATGYIRSTSANGAGGSAKAIVAFNYNNGTESVEYTEATAELNVLWRTPEHSVAITTPSPISFLKSYASANFTANTLYVGAANRKMTLTPTGGTISGTGYTNKGDGTYEVAKGTTPGTGTLTFTSKLHKSNYWNATTRIVLHTALSRPAAVTGTAVETVITADANSNPSTGFNRTLSFTYPSFQTWTDLGQSPNPSSCVNDSDQTDGFNRSNVTVLGNQQRSYAGYVTNNISARIFWFACKAGAPLSDIQTGGGPNLLNPAEYITTTISLAPNDPTASPLNMTGYSAEVYDCYGIIIGKQDTPVYISIS